MVPYPYLPLPLQYYEFMVHTLNLAFVIMLRQRASTTHVTKVWSNLVGQLRNKVSKGKFEGVEVGIWTPLTVLAAYIAPLAPALLLGGAILPAYVYYKTTSQNATSDLEVHATVYSRKCTIAQGLCKTYVHTPL